MRVKGQTKKSLIAGLAACAAVLGQERLRTRDVRDIGEAGVNAIPKLAELLKHPDVEIRREAVKELVEIGGQRSLDPLVQAVGDNDAEIQIRATDGLVNFYLPGYVKTGFSATLRRAGTSVKGRFTDVNDQVIDPFVEVRTDVVRTLGVLARGGVTMETRANAARAVGVLRGRGAIPDLLAALRSKDSSVLYEALIALQKIRDPSAGPQIAFLLRDLDPKVQAAAIETTGLLQNKEALPQLVEALNRARDRKVRRAALTAIAMLPHEKSRPLYQQYLQDSDDRLRGAAAEGFARLKNPPDLPMLEKAWEAEEKTSPRLSLAFALVMLGRHELAEFSPLQYLINTLNSRAYQGEAYALLVEAARDAAAGKALHAPMMQGTRDEKIYLARVLSRSGGPEAAPYLEKLSRDPDTEVAQEGLRALRTLQARPR